VYYSRMKGELEDAVAKLPFRKLVIIRPSILDGDRQEKRAGEKVGLILSRFVTRFILKVYKPTPVNLLASKMISLSLQKVPGIITIGGLDLFQN